MFQWVEERVVEVGKRSVETRLSVMMAGVYAVQGAWWPLLALHLSDLGVSGRARGWIFATLAMGSLLTPVGAGQVADRRIAAPHLLALTYGLGMLLLLALAAGWVSTALPLFLLFLTYWLLTAPGSGLCGTIALRNLPQPSAQFGSVRLWGTAGWMVAGWLVSAVMLASGSTREGQGAYEAFGVATVLAGLFSAYSLTLPRTPPLVHAVALAQRPHFPLAPVLGQRPVVFLLVLAFVVSLTTPFVYQVVPAYLPTIGLPRGWIALAMSLGQVLEIVALAVLPRALGMLGYRGCLCLGVLAWLAYHGLMASHPPLALALAVLPLQGLAIALFHVTGPMLLDTLAPGNLRASTQGLYVMATNGLGNLLGSLMAGELVSRAGGVTPVVFLAPVAINGLALMALIVGFRWAVGPGRRGSEHLAVGRGQGRWPLSTLHKSHETDDRPHSLPDTSCARRVGSS
jgi:MFS family permease